MSWRDDLMEFRDQYEKAVRRDAKPVSPEKRRREEAASMPIFIGAMAGMVMGLRQPFTGVAELALWLIAATALTVWLGSARRWSRLARVGSVIATPATALALTAGLMAVDSFLMALG